MTLHWCPLNDGLSHEGHAWECGLQACEHAIEVICVHHYRGPKAPNDLRRKT